MIITFFLGLIVELIQAGINRTPDIGDLVRNFIGSFIALFFFAPKKNEMGFYKLCLSKSILILLIAFQILPIINFLRDERHANIEFPLLSGFESKLEPSRWTGDADFVLSKEIKTSEIGALLRCGSQGHAHRTNQYDFPCPFPTPCKAFNLDSFYV